MTDRNGRELVAGDAVRIVRDEDGRPIRGRVVEFCGASEGEAQLATACTSYPGRRGADLEYAGYPYATAARGK